MLIIKTEQKLIFQNKEDICFSCGLRNYKIKISKNEWGIEKVCEYEKKTLEFKILIKFMTHEIFSKYLVPTRC